MNSDLTFITNEEDENLSERFKMLIEDTRLFDVLVGYFYTSGFHEKFKKLEYQEQAVLNARKILLEYGGVFISDVVGLGKTYISAMLAGQLEGRNPCDCPARASRKIKSRLMAQCVF